MRYTILAYKPTFLAWRHRWVAVAFTDNYDLAVEYFKKASAEYLLARMYSQVFVGLASKVVR